MAEYFGGSSPAIDRYFESKRRMRNATALFVAGGIMGGLAFFGSRTTDVQESDLYKKFCGSVLGDQPFLAGDPSSHIINCQPEMCTPAYMQLEVDGAYKNTLTKICMEPQGDNGMVALPLHFGDDVVTTDVLVLEASASAQTIEGDLPVTAAGIFADIQRFATVSDTNEAACLALQETLLASVADSPQYTTLSGDRTLVPVDQVTYDDLQNPHRVIQPVIITASHLGAATLSQSDTVLSISSISGSEISQTALSCRPDPSEVVA